MKRKQEKTDGYNNQWQGRPDDMPLRVRRHDKLALWRHEELVPSMSQEGLLDDHSND
jgi:hypothetical protein